jgi:uncharacterized protein (TIGR00369 family)
MSGRRHAAGTAEMVAFVEAHFPEAGFGRGQFVLEQLGPDHCRVRMPFDPAWVRPGPTVSGPAIMYLADIGAWIAVLAAAGLTPSAVTATLNITFLRGAGQNDLLCDTRVLKAGKKLVSTAAEILRADTGEMVAHATTTYALPRS